ncbi:hypothetical protein BU15DRAFT_72192 [Melanogaster broomeanus]|nr:hypothetical protein BU15DRAFT_72192 [Melanogaster broomeanus]
MSSSSDPEKDLAVVVWWGALGISLFFRPAAELGIRAILFFICTVLVGALDGSLNLLIGHAILKAARCSDYEASILSSMEAGALGGISVIGPIILLAAFLVAMAGNANFHRFIPGHVALLLEIAIIVAVSTAACPVGVVVVRHMQFSQGPPLGPLHAARAGALGASILTVPLLSIAAFFMRESNAHSVRNSASVPSTHPVRLFRVGGACALLTSF